MVYLLAIFGHILYCLAIFSKKNNNVFNSIIFDKKFNYFCLKYNEDVKM